MVSSSVVPQFSKSAFRALTTGLTSCARMIGRCGKGPQGPTLKLWKEQMMGIVAHERMVGELNFTNNVVLASLDICVT